MKKIILLPLALLLAGQLLAQPVITTQPTNQTVLTEVTALLSVTVSGSGPFTYQWQFNGTNLPINITTVAGNGTNGYSGDGGAATNAGLKTPNAVAFDTMGNLFIADYGNNRIRKVDANGIITTVAGNGTNGFSGDGAAAINAKMSVPSGVALDPNGNLFIADGGNNRIRKVDASGIITTVAGKTVFGFSGDGGLATNAGLSLPAGVTLDAAGNLFIADQNNNRIRKVDTNGIITTVAGKNNIGTGFSGDGGAATNASLFSPSAVAFDNAGNLFIADVGNNRIRKVDTNGIITTVTGKSGGSYSGDGGLATNANLKGSQGVMVDGSGYLLIADAANYRIRQVDPSGIITTVAGNGTNGFSGDGGAATNASLSFPAGVAMDSFGNLFIADYNNNRIRKVALARYPTLALNNVTTNNTGDYTVIITSPSGSVTSSVVTLTVVVPASIASQPQSLLVTNGSPASLTLTAFGTGLLSYQWFFNTTNTVDGGTNATLNFGSTSPNLTGNYFCVITNAYGSATSSIVTLTVVALPVIATQPTNQIVINGGNTAFSVEVSGTGPFSYQWRLNGTNILDNTLITTVAGSGTSSYSGDGGVATNATLSTPYSVAADVNGNLFIADYGNERVRKVDTGGMITTVAGNGSINYSGDGGMATNAGLYYPQAVAVDSSGNLFIADQGNFRIRRVSANGIITTVAGGNGNGYYGDGGPATNAGLSLPISVAVDSFDNLFIADGVQRRIRQVSTNGIITTVAGNGGFIGSGDGGPATNASFSEVVAATVDAAGNLYVAGGSIIRKVDTNGFITRFAGNGSSGYSGDGGAATNASLSSPRGMTADVYGNLFIADRSSSRIRKVDLNGIITTVAGKTGAGYSGDGGVATNAGLSSPYGVALDVSGNLFIADSGNNRIRKVNLAGLPQLTLNNVTPTGALLLYSPLNNSVFLKLNGLGAASAGNFSVIITSPYGSVTSSVVTLTVILPPQNFRASVGNDFRVQLQFSGSPGHSYILQAATNLVPPVNWQTVITNLADTNGNWTFFDTNSSQYPQRFYRVSP